MQKRKILVLRLGAIGDVLRVLPAVRRIRRDLPGIEIGWAVEHWAYPIIAGNPNVDRFHILDRRELRANPWRAQKEIRRHAREIRENGYDILLDFHGRLKSGFISRLSGIPRRIGYAKGYDSEQNHLFNNVHVTLGDRWQNRVLRFLDLLGPLGVDTAFDPSDLGVYVDPVIRADAQTWYEGCGSPELAVFPGTSAARVRERWPAKKWVELLTRTGEAGVRSVVFWGPEEQQLAADIVSLSGSHTAMAPPTTLPEMMGMIGCFKAFIGSDTAAMHMAWMQGVPTALFVGPKPPRTVAPLEPVPSWVLRADEHYVEGERLSKQPEEIVTSIPVGEAFEAVRYVLAAAADDSEETKSGAQ